MFACRLQFATRGAELCIKYGTLFGETRDGSIAQPQLHHANGDRLLGVKGIADRRGS
jgi:hypothetical protein